MVKTHFDRVFTMHPMDFGCKKPTLTRDCGVVWCGVVWCDVVSFGVVWCGVVLCGVV